MALTLIDSPGGPTSERFRALPTLALSLLVALALVAAACGSDDSDDSADTSATEEATDEPTAEPTETEEATEEATEEPTAEATETEEATAVELTDSAPGVTAEVIRIGVPVIDTTKIGDNPTHEPETMWQAAADVINDEGGVLGRDIELVMSKVDPTDAITQEQVCVELSEDEEVFAVVGVMQDNMSLCYTEVHEIIAINTLGAIAEHFERAIAPYVTVETLPARAAETQVEVLLDSGELDGKTVALSASRGEEGLVAAEAMKELLEAGGVEVVSITQYTQPSSDQAAIDAEFDIFIESWRADGVDAVIAVGTAAVPTTGALSRTGFDPLYVITHPSGTDVELLENLGYSADSLEGAIAVVVPSEADKYEADVAGVKECVDNFDAHYDDDAPVEVRPADGTSGPIGVIVRACQALDLFRLIAEGAGADLTQESFDAAADEVGESAEVTGVILGSLGPGKRDFTDAGMALFVYDPDLRRFVLQ